MIIVTGATGKLGSRVVDQLLTRLPADQVGVSVRDPSRVSALARRGVSVRRGDFTEPATLAEAFADARQVLVVSVDAFGDPARAQHQAAITGAAQAGASRVLYTSHLGANPASAFSSMPDHAVAEQSLAASGVPFTALRNGFYAATVPMLLRRALETGQLITPADGPVSWTTHDDLAEAAAVILADEGCLDGPTPPLTAAEALDFSDIASLTSELTGRSIERVIVEDEDYVAQQVAYGVPEPAALALLGIFRASRRGEFAAVDPTLEGLLGRRPQTVRDVLVEHLSR